MSHLEKPNKLEQAFYTALDKHGIDYRPQVYIDGIGTRVDALVGDIAIYVDGDYWHGNPDKYNELSGNQAEVRQRDRRFNEQLRLAGYTVLRFWEADLNENMLLCMDIVKERLAAMGV